jgi:UDPglucose 6-dehydrogenase
LCEAAGGDIEKIAEGIGLDRRIGPAFLRPGIGFGGFCFPKDLQAFTRIAEKFGCDFKLLEEVGKINSRRVKYFVEKLRRELWVLRGKTVAVWGLAFKPNTDDVRYSPALEIVRSLLAEGARIQAYDPQAMAKAQAELPEVAYCENPYAAARSASAILALTEWDEFQSIDWDRLRELMDRPLIFDGRNMYSRQDILSHGFQYLGVGSAAQPELVGTAGLNE